MLTLGLKFTHDAGMALLDGNQLLGAIEIEKLGNSPRHASMPHHWQVIAKEFLASHNRHPSHLANIVIDGWDGYATRPPNVFKVAPYNAFEHIGDPQHDAMWNEKEIPHFLMPEIDVNWPATYCSVQHITSHMLGAYVMSPYSKTKTPCAILVWDGGAPPRLYWCDPNSRELNLLNTGMQFTGLLYGIMTYYWGPFKQHWIKQCSVNPMLHTRLHGGTSNQGKIMAWLNRAVLVQELLLDIEKIYAETLEKIKEQYGHCMNAYVPQRLGFYEHEFCREIDAKHGEKFLDEQILATIHYWIGMKLLDLCNVLPPYSPLIHVGGPALNIKWNSNLRRNIGELWVPPNCNDSGTALGAACAYLALEYDIWSIDWQPYAGHHAKRPSTPLAGWQSVPMPPYELGRRLAQGAPCVVLQGRAEIGPRALGNRSILADPRRANMAHLLNVVKHRELWRPVAPICMEEHAPLIFEPGTPDPYMLFEHQVRHEWRDIIPAIVHIDGSARLQTVSQAQHPNLYAILRGFFRETNCPVLCNTSANYVGRGFFPDVASAMKWIEHSVGLADIWHDGTLFVRTAL